MEIFTFIKIDRDDVEAYAIGSYLTSAQAKAAAEVWVRALYKELDIKVSARVKNHIAWEETYPDSGSWVGDWRLNESSQLCITKSTLSKE
jgi:hypothetical protein